MIRRLVVPLVLAAAMHGAARAQVIGIELDPLAAKTQYAKWVTMRSGAPLIIGEAIEGVNISPERSISQVPGAKRFVLVVLDPARPDLKMLDVDAEGKRVVVAGDRVVAIDNKHVKHSGPFHLILRDQTCEGLRTEYLRKAKDIAARRAAQRAAKLGTPEWFTAQRSLLTSLDGLAAWLRSTLFSDAAAKLEAEYGAELKRGGGAASKSRLEMAKKALKPAMIPNDLATASFGISLKWHGREAQHLRIIATTDVPVSMIEASVLLGERIVEGFRVEFVDYLIGGDEIDPIPEKIFLELFLCPKDDNLAARYLEDYYGKRLGTPRDRMLKMGGYRERAARGVDFLSFQKFAGDDLDGHVAHALGHALSTLAFNHGASGGEPAWLDEGFAYWVSFEYLSRNSVTCFQFNLPSYGKEAAKDGDKIVQLGMRAAFNQLALEKGASLSDIMRMKLADMSSPDLAKAWSLVDFLATKHRDKLVRLLRGACDSTDKNEQIELEKYRPIVMECFGVKEGDVYLVFEDLWKTYALTGQKVARQKKE